MELLATFHFTSGAKAREQRGKGRTVRDVGVGEGEVDAAVLHRCDVQSIFHVLVDAAEGGREVLVRVAIGGRERKRSVHAQVHALVDDVERIGDLRIGDAVQHIKSAIASVLKGDEHTGVLCLDHVSDQNSVLVAL